MLLVGTIFGTSTTSFSSAQQEVISSGNGCYLSTYNTYVTVGQIAYTTGLENIGGSECFFTSASLGSSSNPQQTFGLKTIAGNDSISVIIGAHVQIMTTAQAGEVQNTTYYFVNLPLHITLVSIGSLTIPQSAYYTNFAQWSAAASPAVYYNSAGAYLEVDTTGSQTINFGTYISCTTNGALSVDQALLTILVPMLLGFAIILMLMRIAKKMFTFADEGTFLKSFDITDPNGRWVLYIGCLLLVILITYVIAAIVPPAISALASNPFCT